MKLREESNLEFTKIDNPTFRKAFCVKPGFRYSSLKPFCREIEFITDGFSTDMEDLSTQISEVMADYNSEMDVLVPTGTAVVNMLIGYYISKAYPDKYITVAFFQKEVTKFNRTVVPEHYEFYRFNPAHILTLWN